MSRSNGNGNGDGHSVLKKIMVAALGLLLASSIGGAVVTYGQVQSQAERIDAHQRLDDTRFDEIQRRLKGIEDKVDTILRRQRQR